MIENVLLDYLNHHLEVPAFMEYPKQPPDRFVLIEKEGSHEINQLQSAIFAFQSYAKTLYDAAALNHQLKLTMREITKVTVISKAQLNSDYNFTDTATKEYRYQAVYDINYYE